jgi:NAD+ kinase
MSDSSRIERVLVVAKVGTAPGRQMARELGDWLIQRGVDVDYEGNTAQALGLPPGIPRDKIPGEIDMALVAGGDGTLLSVAREVAPLGIPILGVNLGTLGFLTELPSDERFSGLEAVLAGRYTVEERQTLRVRYRTEGTEPRQYALLNDAVITKSALARMIDLAVRIDGENVVSYKSDGLIVATPTGSTAYSLSAGGPILDPRMRAFVITPICPHTMNLRPLVVPGNVQIEVTVRSADEEAFLTLDGQLGFPVEDGDRLVIDDHPNPVRLVRVAERGFFEVLRRKLRWGES